MARGGWRHRAAANGVLCFDGHMGSGDTRARYIAGRFSLEQAGTPREHSFLLSRELSDLDGDAVNNEVVLSFTLSGARRDYREDIIELLMPQVFNSEDVPYLEPGVPIQLVPRHGFAKIQKALASAGELRLVRGTWPGLERTRRVA